MGEAKAKKHAFLQQQRREKGIQVIDIMKIKIEKSELLPKPAQLLSPLLDAQSQPSPRSPSANHMGALSVYSTAEGPFKKCEEKRNVNKKEEETRAKLISEKFS
jgi:hypothetical protein